MSGKQIAKAKAHERDTDEEMHALENTKIP